MTNHDSNFTFISKIFIFYNFKLLVFFILDGANEDSLRSEQAQDLLTNVTLQLKGFDDEQEHDLLEVIESRGGTIISGSSKTAQFVILPMNYVCESFAADVMVGVVEH